MLIHASCAARDGNGVLLIGPSGSGKSDLLLRLLDRGFSLVADDQVDLADDIAQPPPALAGLLEVRGLGILRLPYVAPVRVILDVTLGDAERLPSPCARPAGRASILIDPDHASAAQRIELAFECALGRIVQHTGAFSSW